MTRFRARGGSMRFVVMAMVVSAALGAVRPLCAQAPARSAPEPGPRPAARPDEVELSDETELARIVGLYEGGKYAECATELDALLNPTSKRALKERDVIQNARIYHAACLIGSGRPELADEPLRAAILDDVQMKPPDSLVFPQPVVQRFLVVRQSMFDEIRKEEAKRVEAARRSAERLAELERREAERVAELERLAAREVSVVRNRRWIGFVPFGVGQFQNGNEGLGWVFLTSETVLAATALTSLAMQTRLSTEAQRLQNEDNNSVLTTWHTLLEVSSYSLLAVMAIGVTEAQLSFVPETREERVRPLPPRLRRSSAVGVWPNVAPQPDGVAFGLSGRF